VVWDLFVKRYPKVKTINPTKAEWTQIIQEIGDQLPSKDVIKLGAILSHQRYKIRQSQIAKAKQTKLAR